MDAAKVILFLVLFGIALYIGMWQLWEHAGDKTCKTFTNSTYTGRQKIDGHVVECFHGQIVEVHP